MKEFLLKIKNKSKSFISIKRMNPHIYWNNLLYAFFVVVIILILFSFYLLYKIKNQQIFQAAPGTTGLQSLMNEKLLNSVNDSFNSKLIKQKEIQNGLDTYKDPSI